MIGRYSPEPISRQQSGGQPVWPVARDQVKDNAQIDHNSDDTLLLDDADKNNGIIPAAVGQIERLASVAFVTQTRRWVCDGQFPSEPIELSYPPLQSVESVKYLDSDDAEQTVATTVYRAATKSWPGRLTLKSGQSWPSTGGGIETIDVQFKCGFGDAASDVPMHWKQPLIVLATYWYNNRHAYAERGMDVAFERQLQAMIDNAGRMVRYV